MNWNPVFETENSVESFQRDLCWNLEDKQLLIESIYNQISIGRFVFRKRSWEYVQKYKDDKLRMGSFTDIVDGKQRLYALKEFRENVFSDLNGYYFKNFSKNAQEHFLSYSNLTIAELPENSTDEDVKELFLRLNTSGKAMSNEHIEKVKNIKLKQ